MVKPLEHCFGSQHELSSMTKSKSMELSLYIVLRFIWPWIIFTNLFYYSVYFFYYLWVSLYFLILFIYPINTILINFYLLTWIIFTNLFYYSVYFYYYSWVLLHILVLFIDLIILFPLTFTFIYSIFNRKISILAK